MPAASSARAVGRPSREKEERWPWAAGGRPPPPRPLAASASSRAASPPAAERAAPAKGPRSPGRTRLGGSLPPLARPVLVAAGRGDGVLSPLPQPSHRRPARSRERESELQEPTPARGAGGPAAGEREGAGACPRLAGDGKARLPRESEKGGGETPGKPKAAQRSRLLARGGAGRAGRRGRSRASAGAAPALPQARPLRVRRSPVGAAAATPPPCRHRRVRDAAPAGRSGERAGAVRVGGACSGGGPQASAGRGDGWTDGTARRGWRLPG